MSSKLKICLFSMLLIQSAIVYAKSPQPSYCPSIDAIKAVPVTAAVKLEMGGWLAFNPTKNKYDTGEEWTFMMLVGNANSEPDAITKANNNLALIGLVDGPSEHQNPESWGCLYTSRNQDDAFLGLAVTPPFVALPELIGKFIR